MGRGSAASGARGHRTGAQRPCARPGGARPEARGRSHPRAPPPPASRARPPAGAWPPLRRRRRRVPVRAAPPPPRTCRAAWPLPGAGTSTPPSQAAPTSPLAHVPAAHRGGVALLPGVGGAGRTSVTREPTVRGYRFPAARGVSGGMIRGRPGAGTGAGTGAKQCTEREGRGLRAASPRAHVARRHRG